MKRLCWQTFAEEALLVNLKSAIQTRIRVEVRMLPYRPKVWTNLQFDINLNIYV